MLNHYFLVPCLKIVMSKTMGILVLMATVFGEWPTLFDTNKSVFSLMKCYIILFKLFSFVLLFFIILL